jgi:subtilisin family serine protease
MFLTPRGPVEVPDLETGANLTIGGLSRYSNAGYLRRRAGPELVKPDVTAPGQYHVAPAADGTPPGFRDKSGRYRIFNGTSAAAPYAAGVAALLLEQRPALTADDFHRLLQKHLTQDAQTGACPNPRWGYGKLDAAAVDRMIQGLR